MNKLSVLLIGIGGYGGFYLNEFLDRGDDSFTVAGVADPFAAGSPRFAELETRGIPVFAAPDDFYASDGRADLVVIASPIHTHYPYILTCFEHGSNVLCEKPVTGSLTRLDDLIEREEKSGLFAAVGFQLSYSRNVQNLKADIMKGLFGKPLELKGLNLPRRGTKYYSRNSWVGKLEVGGEMILDSPLNNACGHELHNMLFLLGNSMNSSVKVASVEAETWRARPNIENYDSVGLRVRTDGGAKVLFYTAHCVEENAGPLGLFTFENAVIHWKQENSVYFIAKFKDGTEKVYKAAEKTNAIQKFYDALESVRTGTRPVCTMRTVRSHLECVSRVQGFPMTEVPRDKLAQGQLDNDDFFYVPGLREAFLHAYEKGVLPSETGFVV